MNPKHALLWCFAPWAVSGDEHFACNEWFGRSLHISYSIQPDLPRTPTPLSPFDGSFRCLKEINYPRSFSTSSSSVVALFSVPASPTSVRVQSQRTLPYPSSLLLRLLSRLLLGHRCTITSPATTHDMCSPFSQSCRQVLCTLGQFYAEPAHRFAKQAITRTLPQGVFCRTSRSPILCLLPSSRK